MTDAPRSMEQITAVYVEPENATGLEYVCQHLDEAGGWVCGQCGRGALGPLPIVGDICTTCGAKVRFVRRGAPFPLNIRGDEPWL